MKKKILVGISIIGILCWQLGFLSRYNYITAKIDCWQGYARIVTIGEPLPCGVPCISLNEKYRFYRISIGCFVTTSQLRGINTYNTVVEKYLNKRNGQHWRDAYNAEMSLLIKNNKWE